MAELLAGLRRLEDPRLSRLHVTRVQMTDDLQLAKVYVHATGDVEHEPPSNPCRNRSKLMVGGGTHLGKHRERVIRVLLSKVRHRVLVDLTYLGADLVKFRITSQLRTRGRSTVVVSNCLLRVFAFQDDRGAAGIAPYGAVAFPESSSDSRGCSVASTASQISRITDSGVLSPPS